MSFVSRLFNKSAREENAHKNQLGSASHSSGVVELFKGYSASFSSGLLDEKHVLLVSRSSSSFSTLLEWVRAQGSSVFRVRLADISKLSRLTPSKWALIVVDGDSEDLTYLLEQLQDLRERYDDIPLILTSRLFGCDDMSLSRLTVCDASLRMPFQFRRLEFAALMARENNLVWQDRLTERRHGLIRANE